MTSATNSSSTKEPLYDRSSESGEMIRIPCSDDYGDPTLYETLRWHISVCARCAQGEMQGPPAFGKRDSRHCDEYYQIAQEYSEYEADYAMKGNP